MRPTLNHLRTLCSLLLLLGLAACSVQQTRLNTDAIAGASQPEKSETTIALLGGTGFIGGYLLQEALARGHSLRVLSRSSDKLAYLGERITVVQGDARDPAVLKELVAGADVVMSALGPTRSRGDSRSGLNSEVTRTLIPILHDAGISRYLVVSGAGVVMPGDDRNLSGWWMRQLVRLRYPGILADRQLEYGLLAETTLNWTLLRCPLVEGEAFDSPAEVSLQTPGGFYLRAGELARFTLGLVENPDFARKGPFLSSN